MIPKVIHYCWFGEGKKNKLVKKCINSWKKYCPDYKIIEWNEKNYDLSFAPLFVRQALEAKQWAFATDYIRLQIVYEHGGIYLDTDVELVKSLDSLLYNKLYFGIQSDFHPATGLGFGAEKGVPFLKELMSTYENCSFIAQDGYDLTPCTERDIHVFLAHGLIMDGTDQMLDGYIHIYPKNTFNPLINGSYLKHLTEDTISIHWYASLWFTKKQKKSFALKRIRKTIDIIIDYIVHIPNRIGRMLLGSKRYDKLKKTIKKSE